MFDVILVVGKAGSGKDTFVSNLLKTSSTYNKIITCTTRPQRENEQDGQDYYFKTEDEFKSIDFIEQTKFNNWYYGTPAFSFDANKINIVIVNPEGVRSYMDRERFNIIAVYYLKADNQIRLKRQMARETNADLYEIQRRYKADEEDFKEFEYYMSTRTVPLITRSNNDIAQLQANIEELNLFVVENMGKTE